MSTRVVDRVDSWDQRPFEGGYRNLQELADSGFSGVVRAGGAELYLTKGTVVGVEQGRIEDVEGATGTIYEAPTPALPLLAIMQGRGNEARAKYYTEDTDVSTVDQKLAGGNFTGFIELSENVLSGDYYVVYHQGNSMSVAFVGESARLLDADEAFRELNDEVGIYEVTPVEIEPVQIPEQDETATAAAAAESDTDDVEASTANQPSREEDESSESQEEDEPGETSGGAESDTEPEPQPTEQAGSSETEKAASDGEPRETSPESSEQDRPDTRDAREASRGLTDAGRGTGTQRRGASTTTEESSRGGSSRGSGSTGSPPNATSTDRSRSDGTGSRESGGGGAPLETHSIPSLDPARTEAGESTPDKGPTDSPTRRDSGQARAQTESRKRADTRSTPREQSSSQTATERSEEADRPEKQPSTEPADTERVAELESELEDRESRLEELESDLEGVETEREDLEAELEAVQEERDELAEEVERLESEIESLESEFGAASGADRRLTPREALDGTDIFVRYDSKSDATLAKAHDGGIRRSDLEDNLRLEKHTQFDEASVAVGGQQFAEFLENRLEFQFVEWVIYELLFEIRDTGHSSGLEDLFDAIPDIDRAELNAVVEVVYSEEGQETRSTESFDVVLRDRMGDALVVANLNDSREAATEGDMENLVTAAERVGQTAEDFSAAFLVTRSFFEPGALEMSSEATRGGILSRDKRQSFVNLSRKRGYHLCLVEARNDNFNLAVPEL